MGETMKKNTIIFDLDGTLLYTLEDLKAAVNHALILKGYKPRSLEEMRHFFGNGIRYALREAEPEASDEDIAGLVSIFKEYYREHCLDKTCPYKGIPELVSGLAAEGYKLAIVSNKVDMAVKELAEHFFPEIQVAIGESPEVRRKPAPDTVFTAMKELGASAEDSVYVGDSEVDLATARAAGLPCISVLWGFRDRELLEAEGAECFAETPDMVREQIEKMNS